MKVGFNRGVKREFHGANVTSNGGHFAASLRNWLRSEQRLSGTADISRFRWQR